MEWVFLILSWKLVLLFAAAAWQRASLPELTSHARTGRIGMTVELVEAG